MNNKNCLQLLNTAGNSTYVAMTFWNNWAI